MFFQHRLRIALVAALGAAASSASAVPAGLSPEGAAASSASAVPAGLSPEGAAASSASAVLPAVPDGLSSYLIYDGKDVLRDSPAEKPEAPSAADWPAADERDLSRLPGARRGWVATPSSLLLYDSSGTLAAEVGLGRWDEESGGLVKRRTVRGGVSEDGRFAWSWEKAESFKPGRGEKGNESARLMRYLGTDGGELFRDELVDRPKDLEPVFQSANGETLLVAERGPDGWIMAAYVFTGNRLLDAHEAGSIEAASLTPLGRFAIVRWHQLDAPPVYTAIDLERKKTRAILSSDLPPAGEVRIDEDGKAYAGPKEVLELR